MSSQDRMTGAPVTERANPDRRGSIKAVLPDGSVVVTWRDTAPATKMLALNQETYSAAAFDARCLFVAEVI